MLKYCIKRILLAVGILFGVSVLLYFLVCQIDVNGIWEKIPKGIELEGTPEEMYAKMAAQLGIPAKNDLWGMIKGYCGWLWGVVRGDFGTSIKYELPVEEVIFKNMGVSFAVSLISTVLQLVIAIPLGIKCACNQYGKLDYTATFLTMIGISFPTFFLANIAIKIFAVELDWLPVGGLGLAQLSDTATWWDKMTTIAYHLIMPIGVLVVLSIGSWSRYTRTNTLEVLNADYIRTARAKGLSERSVVYKHVFRNTMIPLVTVLAGTLPSLFGGAMITETIFALPGVGNVAYQAMLAGDIPFIMGYNMFIAVLTVLGILLTDIMYAVVDPRVKLA